MAYIFMPLKKGGGKRQPTAMIWSPKGVGCGQNKNRTENPVGKERKRRTDEERT
jgi:hypothetical protein